MPRQIKPNEDEQRLFNGLVQRHGADEITVALCRSMAVLLANEVIDPRAAQSAAALAALLPSAKDAEGKPPDWDLLTDRQSQILRRLYDIATGERPAVPEHRQKSARHWEALRAAAILDGFYKRAARPDEDWKFQTPAAVWKTSENPVPVTLTATERAELRTAIDLMLRPIRISDLYDEVLRNAYAPTRSAVVPPADKNVPAAAAESAQAIPARTDNVLPMPRPPTLPPLEERYPLSDLSPVDRW
jgi:hypothetical protein